MNDYCNVEGCTLLIIQGLKYKACLKSCPKMTHNELHHRLLPVRSNNMRNKCAITSVTSCNICAKDHRNTNSVAVILLLLFTACA